MKQRRKAALAGLLCSLPAVGIWIFVSTVLGWLAGIAGALMGILFLLPYKKLNPRDQTAFPYVAGGCVIVVEVCLAELVSLAILAAAEGIALATALAASGVRTALLTDVLLGLGLSALVFGFDIYDVKRRQKQAARQVPAAAAAELTAPVARIDPETGAPPADRPERKTPAAGPAEDNTRI